MLIEFAEKNSIELQSKRAFKKSIQTSRNLLLSVCLLLFIGQVIIQPTWTNITASGLASLTMIVATISFVRVENAVNGRYLTALLGMLLIGSNSLVPLIGTLMDGHGIDYELETPIYVFSHRAVFAFCVVLSHFSASAIVFRRFKSKIGSLFDLLPVRGQLPYNAILFGIPLLLAYLIARKIAPSETVVTKILDGLNFLALVPYLLLVPPYLTRTLRHPEYVLMLIVFYAFQLGLGITSRTSLVLPFAIVSTGWFAMILSGVVVFKKRYILAAAPICAVGLLFAVQLNHISKAILIERAHRDTRSSVENLTATIETYFDIAKLEAHESLQDTSISEIGAWNENYIASPFIARFTAIKFDDNCLSRTQLLNESDVTEIRVQTLNKLWSLLPEMSLKLFGLEVDKKYTTSFSMGDLIDFKTNRAGFLGGMKTGSVVAHFYILFGWFYPATIFVLLFLVFLLLQTLATPSSIGVQYNYTNFSMLLGFLLFLDLSVEGLHVYAAWLLRGVWERVLLFGCYLVLVNLILKSLKRNLRHTEPVSGTRTHAIL